MAMRVNNRLIIVKGCSLGWVDGTSLLRTVALEVKMRRDECVTRRAMDEMKTAQTNAGC